MAFWKVPTLVVLLFTFSTCSNGITFTITNNCSSTIWPGTMAGSTAQLSRTGFRLEAGRSVKLTTSGAKWSGRIWGRTGCKFDGNGEGKCETGDCGGKLECEGNGAAPPVSLFEITLGGGTGQDFYDVSLVDGYNLPMLAVPSDVYGTSACNSTGCISNLNIGCPKELQVKGSGGVIGCRSACEAFDTDQYCCRGQHGGPSTCPPSQYSTMFKKACPRAYSYAYDDATSTFTCKAYGYHIIFCPSASSRIRKPRNKRDGKTQQVGSSNALSPYSYPTSLYIASLAFWTSMAAWSFT